MSSDMDVDMEDPGSDPGGSDPGGSDPGGSDPGADSDGAEAMEVDLALGAAALDSLSALRRSSSLPPEPPLARRRDPDADARLAPPRALPTPGPRAAAAAAAEITLVPDTNALVRRGGASLRELLERFRPTPAAAARVLVLVPRRVVQELDGLKLGGAAAPEVAALARGVNRALQHHLRAQHRAPAESSAAAEPPLASLAIQGPADAARMRAAMRRAEGTERFAPGPSENNTPSASTPVGSSADEEIVYFCQERRRGGELVCLLTMDVNAAVTAAAHASPDDVPVATLDPNRLARDADALAAETAAFYERVARANAEMERRKVSAGAESARDASSAGRHRDASSAGRGHRPSPARDEGTNETRDAAFARVDLDFESEASAVLAALDDAFPAAVEAVLRAEFGPDLWRSAVADETPPGASRRLSANGAFDAFRKNFETLVAGAWDAGEGGASSARRRVRAGRAAMDALADARRRRDRAVAAGHGSTGFGTREACAAIARDAAEVLEALRASGGGEASEAAMETVERVRAKVQA